MSTHETVCRVEPALVHHVTQLLADAGLTCQVVPDDSDGLIDIRVPVEDGEHARSVIGLVLPQLLSRPDSPGTVHLSDRLVRSEDDRPTSPDPMPGTLPGGLIDARPTFGYADPLADSADEDDGDFVPPPPPPLPRPKDRWARAAWAAVVAGPLVLIVSHLLGWVGPWTTLGLALFIGGFVTLVARMEDRAPKDDGWDDGAVI